MESRDGGFEFGRPRYVNEACGSSTKLFSLSCLAADASEGPSRDIVYFACNQASTSRVVVSVSGDGGESWTEARPIDAAPVDSTVSREVMGTAVSPGGVLGVAWVESGRNPAGPCADDVWFTASVDGGETFLPPTPIASPESCAAADANGSGFPGDYFGLATDTNGRFRLLWSGVREGLLQLDLGPSHFACSEWARRRHACTKPLPTRMASSAACSAARFFFSVAVMP